MARKSTRKQSPVTHHIIYNLDGCTHKQEAVVVFVLNYEHWILTQLQRRGRTISRGFLNSLKYLIWLWETTGIIYDLKPGKMETKKQEE